MNRWLKRSWGILAALLAAGSSLGLTVAMLWGLQRTLDLNLFSIMLWGILPIGALVTGLAVAGGFYAGAVWTGLKPTKGVAVWMLAASASAQAALYYLQYRGTVLDSGEAVSTVVGFGRFVRWSLSHAVYQIELHGAHLGPLATFEGGWWGYAAATLQFLGLIVGGFMVYALLADRPYCDGNGRYLKKEGTLRLLYLGDEAWLGGLRQLPAPSLGYFERLARRPDGGSALLQLEWWRCPDCGREALVEKPEFYRDGKTVTLVGGNRTVWVQPGDSVRQAFEALSAAR